MESEILVLSSNEPGHHVYLLCIQSPIITKLQKNHFFLPKKAVKLSRSSKELIQTSENVQTSPISYAVAKEIS